jgi:actin-like ATPase involved in cell morphogenesis
MDRSDRSAHQTGQIQSADRRTDGGRNQEIKIGSADELPEERRMEIKGRDLVAGLPRTVTVTSEEIR